ncbi:HDOD domain-containing protein [bacterium]|nr:HDOD domain-containing protein [bacterium]
MKADKPRVEDFIAYLCQNEIIDETSAKRAFEQIGRVDLRFGRIALLEGFVTPEEINKILWIQREAADKKFGEVALELGIMTEDEIRRALELQQDELFAFCQSLVLDGTIAPQTLFALLKGFLERGLEQEMERRRTAQKVRVTKSIRDALKKITVVSPMPGTVVRIMHMLNDPEVDLREVAKVIGFDVGLTAMLLRLANSAFYGVKSEVKTVSKAVTVIGTKKLRQLILSAALMDNFKNLPGSSLAEFWERSMRVAQWSKELSRFAGQSEIDEFFLAGFLHNIGDLILYQHFPTEVRQIEGLVREGRPRGEAEIKAMGCDSPDIGSYLLSLWQLPAHVVQAAMLHRHPRGQIMQMMDISMEAKVVNMAAAISACDESANAFGEGLRISRVVQEYQFVLKIDARQVTDMRDSVDRTVDELLRWFAV